MSTDGRYERFAGRMTDRLGAERVLIDAAAQAAYGPNTIGIRRKIPLALVPHTQDDVVAIIAAAADLKVPLYPISTGNNWGYGSANPVVDGCVVVDLSRMTRFDVDEETGLLTAEPGVTQGMLRSYLDERGLAFLCPVTGAGPDCSLVGNALERGYGITPYADHFLAVMAIEAVLADGTVYRTPLTEMGAAAVDRGFKWGVGPYLDGLFSQGNFGVVTRMTIALAPRPERVEAFYFGVPRDEDLEKAVAAVRRILRELGAVTGSINLMNRRRVLAMMEPYPRDRLGADGLISEDCLLEMAGRSQVMPWMGAGALYGNARVVKAAKSVIRSELRGVAKRLMFFTESSLGTLRGAARALPGAFGCNIRNVLGTLDKSLQLLGGAPSNIALPLAYWLSGRMPDKGQPMNPARDGCGLMWYSPLLPMQPERARTFAAMVERICRVYRVEPLITLTSLSDRCFDSTVPLLFDRESVSDVERIHRCYEALFHAGLAEGFVPYRAGVSSMDLYVDPASPYWRLVQSLKRTADPDNLIAPGRYAPIDPDKGS